MKLLKLLLLVLPLYSQNIKIASYNVQNLFDLVDNETEYKEYIPNTSYNWDKKAYKKKLTNIRTIIKKINADILALQEIENKNVLLDLIKGLNYKYYAISSNKKSIVKVALISKYKIKKKKEIVVIKNSRYRNILKLIVNIKNKDLVIYVNHWPSKIAPESYRIKYAIRLEEEIKNTKGEYIILGDLNSNFKEFIDFKKDYRLNNTNSKTGINHILKTIYKDKIISFNKFKTLDDIYKYNLWNEAKKINFSYKYKAKKNTLDHIIIPKTLIDVKGIDYIRNSFKVFTDKNILKKNRINKWEISKKYPRKHKLRGYSDHLPIYAKFKVY